MPEDTPLIRSLRAAVAAAPADVSLRLHLAELLLAAGQVKDAAAEFAALAATEETPGPGTENLRLFAMDLLVGAGKVCAGVFCSGLLVCSCSEFQSLAWRLTAVLLSIVTWSVWAMWARRRLPRSLVGPLWRLARRTPSLRAAAFGLAGGAVIGLLFLCVPVSGAALGVLLFLGLAVQLGGFAAARVLARKERRPS